ncbi:MAG: iron complex outermembrane receptor protein [Oceanospirillaceae bacterium]|jgi:iron complex outermembrane receptor protein
MTFQLNKIALGMVAALAVSQSTVAMAENEKKDSNKRVSDMETIVVTGTIASGRTKLESSVAITTVSSEELAVKGAFSTADVLEMVPGFWVEDSGGEVSNNVAPRGLGGGSAFRFISMQEDGLPLSYDGNQIDSIMRQDITIERFEAIRGGTAGILTANGPASIVNFITRKGTEDPEGTFKMTLSDYGTYKNEFFYGAPLSDEWLFGIGGYYRSSDGVRDPGFTADHGGQLRMNLTRKMDDGEINFSFKKIDDSNSFYLPVPLTNPNDPKGVPGIDPSTGTLLGPDVARFDHKTPDGGIETNLRDGFHTDYSAFGATFDKTLNDNWSVKASARYSTLDMGINAVFSRSLNSAEGIMAADNVADMVDRFGGAAQLRYSDTGEAITDLAGLNGNGLTVDSIALFREIHNNQFVSDIRFNYSTDSNDLAFGVLFFDYQLKGDRQIGSNYLGEAANNPRRLDIVSVDTNGEVLGQLTDNSVTQYGSWAGNKAGNLTSTSFYVNDEYEVTDDLRIDGGVRYETATYAVSEEVNASMSLDNDDDNIIANDRINAFGTGVYKTATETFNEVSWTVGANYTFTETFALYARYADSYQSPNLGGIGDLNQGISGLVFAEFGGRYVNDTISLSLTAFNTEFDNLGFTARDLVTGVEERIQINTEASGLEFEFTWNPYEDFSLDIGGVVQKTEIIGIPKGDVNEDINGNTVQRTPETNFRITPTYYVGDDIDLFLTYHVLGERFADIGNTVPLPAYETLDMGVTYRMTEQLTVQLKGSNLTDTLGLTEGNPRAGFREGTGENSYLARPILGRAFTLTATYDF